MHNNAALATWVALCQIFFPPLFFFFSLNIWNGPDGCVSDVPFESSAPQPTNEEWWWNFGATLPVSNVAGVELELVVIPQQALLDVTEVHRLPVDKQELHAALEGGGHAAALRGGAAWVERRHGGESQWVWWTFKGEVTRPLEVTRPRRWEALYRRCNWPGSNSWCWDAALWLAALKCEAVGKHWQKHAADKVLKLNWRLKFACSVVQQLTGMTRDSSVDCDPAYLRKRWLLKWSGGFVCSSL